MYMSFLYMCFSEYMYAIFWGNIRVKLLGHRVCIYLALEHTAKIQFLKYLCQLIIPLTIYQDSNCSPFSQKLSIFFSFCFVLFFYCDCAVHIQYYPIIFIRASFTYGKKNKVHKTRDKFKKQILYSALQMFFIGMGQQFLKYFMCLPRLIK